MENLTLPFGQNPKLTSHELATNSHSKIDSSLISSPTEQGYLERDIISETGFKLFNFTEFDSRCNETESFKGFSPRWVFSSNLRNVSNPEL